MEYQTAPKGEPSPLGRGVFDERDMRRGRREAKLHARVFRDMRSPRWSVDRLDPDAAEILTKIGDRRGADRDPARTFYGWAVVSQTAAGAAGRRVETTPQPENPYHVDIVLPKWPENLEERKDLCAEHAGDLAQAASFRERPDVPKTKR